jgi:Ca2+-binding EF-hand superfamily protein
MKTDISKLTTDIMNRYDHNKSGAIEYNNTKEYKEVQVDKKNEKKDDDDTFGTDYYRIVTTDSSKFFKASDENNDGKVERHEVFKQIKKYDKNNDNKLDYSVFGQIWGSKKEGNLMSKDFPIESKETNWSYFKPSQKEIDKELNK